MYNGSVTERFINMTNEKWDEYAGTDGALNKTKMILWGLAGGIPDALVSVGMSFVIVQTWAWITGRKLGYIGK